MAEDPLSGQGPTIDLASKLRECRQKAKLSLEKVEAATEYTRATYSRAASGRFVPSWTVIEEFLRACGTPKDVELVRALHQEAQRHSAMLCRPELEAVSTPNDVVKLLLATMCDCGITVEDLCSSIHKIRRPIFAVGEADLARAAPQHSDADSAPVAPKATKSKRRPKPPTESWTPPSPQDIRAILGDQTRPLTVDLLILALAACGASHSDILYWRRAANGALATSHAAQAGAATPRATLDTDPPTASTPEAADVADQATEATRDDELPAAGDGSTPRGEDTRPPTDATVIAPTVSAARTPASAGRRRLFYRLGGGGIIMLAAAGALASAGLWPDSRPPLPPRKAADNTPHPTPESTTPSAGTPPRSAGGLLSDLATRVAQLPDTQGRGPVTYTYVTLSRLDPALNPADPFAVTDEQRWRLHHGAGKLLITPRLPGGSQPDVAALPPASMRVLRPATTGIDTIDPGTAPGHLAQQLGLKDKATFTGEAALRKVADLHQHHCLRPPQRAAALRVLAEAPGLRTNGEGQDSLGRPGLEISTTTGTTQYRALLDTTTGVLLSLEELSLPAHKDLVTAATVTKAVLFHPCQYRPSLN